MNSKDSKELIIDYFDHEADIGIIGRGKTIESAFVAAATAMFAIMADLTEITLKQSVHIEFEENDIELALVKWLNLLIANAQTKKLVFASFTLKRIKTMWHGTAYGEAWHRDISRGTEVKGATLTMLQVAKKKEDWEARCVVDV